MMDKLTFETTGCAGCRTCEIACSYHHKKVFSPSLSSIEVSDRPERLDFAVSFYIANANGHLACDRCEGEDEPLCLKYCSVLMRDELKAILERNIPQHLPKDEESII
ncbi:hypothetical protein ACFLYV_04180 [Chloroflexota bacterium]